MALGSGIVKQQKKSQDDAQKRKGGLLAKLKDPKKAIMDAVMAKAMGSMDIQTPEGAKANMNANTSPAPKAEAVERQDVPRQPQTSDEGTKALEKEKEALKEDDYTLEEPSGATAQEQSEKKFEKEPTTDHVDKTGEEPTTDHVDKAGEEPDPTEPTLNQPTLNQPALATPHEEQPSITEPTDADVQPPAMATPRMDKPTMDKPKQDEPNKPKEMSNPTLKEKPSKNDSRLKPEMDLPREGDLQ